ncbi:hypothetical protein A9R05_06870 [Burkholderia sp. KK1]|nr:hypothetical protein A9R05_06870 [Burkholderia sp. KK1]
MTSSVSICSNALIRLGDKPISSFEDGTDAATACANLYPSVRDAMLRAHPWNSAVKRVVLAPLTMTPAFDYAYQYQLPADWLRTIQVGARDCALDFTMEGQRILCDANSLPLVYVFHNTIESTWDDTLVELVTMKMASVLAYPITQSSSMQQSMEAQFQMAFKQAKAANGQDDRDETLGDFPLLANRLNGYRSAPGR